MCLEHEATILDSEVATAEKQSPWSRTSVKRILAGAVAGGGLGPSVLTQDEISQNPALTRPNGINSCGYVQKIVDFQPQGGHIEIGKKHGPEEDVFHQGRRQTQGAFDLL
jgi:hypothetical protein